MKLFKTIILFVIITNINNLVFAQTDIDKIALRASNFMLDCSKNTVRNIGVDPELVLKLYKSYYKNGKLTVSEKTTAVKISKIINDNYSEILNNRKICIDDFKKIYWDDLKTHEDLIIKIENLNPTGEWLKSLDYIKNISN